MNILGGMCDTSYSMHVFLIIKVVMDIVCVVVPVIIVIRAIIPFFRASVGGESIKELIPSLVKSFVASFIIFFIPTLVNFTFTKIVDGDYGSISYCIGNASLEKLNELKKKEEEEKKAKDAEERNARNEKYKQALEAEKERQARLLIEREKQKQQGQQSSGGSTGQILKSSSNNIIIGDSRTVGMCAAITGSYSGCSFNSSGPKYYGNNIFISQSAMGYSWFESTAIPTVNAIIQKNPNVTYNIFSLMGVNYLLSDLDKYIVKYNELSSGAWSKHNIILVSVNPVNEAIEAQHGYSTKNVNIISFNNQLKVGTSGKPNIKYCDTFNLINGNFQTGDGLHYSGGTYKDIYNGMMNCVR
jgi:hypothetical protein